MSKLLQTASALAFAAALGAAPIVATAQQTTETEVKQPAETAVQEAKDAAQATGEAVQDTAQEAKEAAGEAVEETKEAASEAVEETKEAAGEAVQETKEVAAEAEQEAKEAAAEAEQSVDSAVTDTEQAVGTTDAATGTTADVKVIEAEPVEGTVAEGAAPIGNVPRTITLQDADSILANDLIGATVYNSLDEEVGEIDNAIISLDGRIEGVVIGVGGFLGLGEKDVAVEMSQISVQTDEDGEPRLVIDTTRDALETAPEFITAEEQQREAAASTAPISGSDTAPAVTAPAPTGMAPAGTETAPAEGAVAPAEGTAAPKQ